LVRTLWPTTLHPIEVAAEYQPGLVSVITPTHNRARYIRRCLKSVHGQSYRPIEHLIVDDGSTDGTASIVEQDARDHEGGHYRVRYIKQENAGAPAARNRGLSESRGEFVQYLDSDDVLHLKKVEIHVAALRKRPECDYVWSEHNAFDADHSDPDFVTYDADALVANSRYIARAETFVTPGNVWTGLYRRSICRAIGPWNEDLKCWEDLEYQMRFTSLAPRCRYVDAVLAAMGNHDAGRIQALGGRVEGIEAGLTALHFMEKTLEAFQVPCGTHARSSVARFYLSIAKLALRYRRPKLAAAAIEGALRNRRDRTFLTRVALLNVMRRLVGSPATAAATDFYSRWRLGLDR
jgi:glycosyltransferase involved in cell wall biosynthesis